MTKSLSSADIEALPYRPCVGVMLLNASGQIWAGRRIDNPGNAWQMPQGGVDDGEAAEAATRAPVRYDLPQDLVPKLWNGRYRGQEQIWFLMRLTGSDDLVNIQTDEPEFSEWRWMPYVELMEFVVPFKAHVYEAAWKEFGPIVEPDHA